MLKMRIGDIVGVHHERHYARDSTPVLVHRLHRAVTAPADRFHADTGTIHRMRREVEEYADRDHWCRFLWKSYCAQYRLPVDADGVCTEKPAEVSPWCHECLTCERIANLPSTDGRRSSTMNG
jgi:hypothetical protein